jgi:general L-amino acid transport system permease protein
MVVETTALQEPILAPEPEGPPAAKLPPREWARQNLFSSPANAVVTVVMGVVVAWALFKAVRWVLVTAEWEIVRRNLTSFMVGSFPRDELWRPWMSLFVIAATVGLAAGMAATAADEQARAVGREPERLPWWSAARRFWPVVALLVAVAVLVQTVVPVLLLLAAAAAGVALRAVGRRLPRPIAGRAWLLVVAGLVVAVGVLVAFGGVGWDRWGGLQLNLAVTVVGIALAFPFGVLLALGRRSSLPAVRAVCVTYIEFIRGVPLVTLLFMGQLFIGFFLPTQIDPPGLVVRALISIVLFEAAYIAEIVRGGLQAVGRGQVEAAQALGLRASTTTRMIVLPQALRAVIPAMVGQFISLFKDTSLLAVIQLRELLTVGQTATQQPDFRGQGLAAVTLPFVAFVFWVGSYTMSRESRRLERRLGIGER